MHAQSDAPVDQAAIQHASSPAGDSWAVDNQRRPTRSATFSLDTEGAYNQESEELNAPKLFKDEDEFAVLPARVTRSVTIQLVSIHKFSALVLFFRVNLYQLMSFVTVVVVNGACRTTKNRVSNI